MKRVVEIDVFNLPVSFNQDTNAFSTGVECEQNDTVTVLDFTETWTRESGILTVSVARG